MRDVKKLQKEIRDLVETFCRDNHGYIVTVNARNNVEYGPGRNTGTITTDVKVDITLRLPEGDFDLPY